MLQQRLRHARISATGRYVPERCLDNAQVSALLGEDVDAWLVKNVGIHRRHVMAAEERTSDLAVAAGKQALERAGLRPEDLDLILIAGDTPDYLSPATASVVQAKLGASRAGVADVNCACASFVTALDMAARYVITDSDFQHVLVVGAYGMTRYVDWKDKATCTLFADGAGAVIVSASDEPGYLGSKLLGRGEYHDALGIYTGGARRPATPENPNQFVEFVRKFPKTFNSEHWPPLIRATLEKAQGIPGAPATLDGVDKFYFTQLNLRTIELMMDALQQPMSKTHWVMDKWGYTGSACIPMALDDAITQGRGPEPGEWVMFCASGGGMAMAASLWRW